MNIFFENSCPPEVDNEKLDEAMSSICCTMGKIKHLTLYEPATYEFIKYFDRAQAIKLISNQLENDIFFLELFNYKKTGFTNLNNIDNTSLYMFIMWLGEYLATRHMELTKLSIHQLNVKAGRYKNYAMLGNMNFTNLTTFTPCQLHYSSMLFVPETIILTKDSYVFTAELAYNTFQTCNKWINDILESKKLSTYQIECLKSSKQFFAIIIDILLNKHPALPDVSEARMAQKTFAYILENVDIDKSEKYYISIFRDFLKCKHLKDKTENKCAQHEFLKINC